MFLPKRCSFSEGAQEVNIDFTRVASVLHGISGDGSKCLEIWGFRREWFATRFGKKKPASRRDKLLILFNKKLVAGAGFEPATFRL